MTISNEEFRPYVWEIEFEAVDGTFSGKFLQSGNYPYTQYSTPQEHFPYGSSLSYQYGSYVNAESIGGGINTFGKLIIDPAVKRIRAAHGENPIRLIARRVWITAPTAYTTTEPSPAPP